MHCRHFKKIKQGLYKQNYIHIFVFVISNDNILHVDNTYMYNAKNVQIVCTHLRFKYHTLYMKSRPF